MGRRGASTAVARLPGCCAGLYVSVQYRLEHVAGSAPGLQLRIRSSRTQRSMAMAVTAFVRCRPRLVGTLLRLFTVPSGAPARALLPAGSSWASQRGSEIQLSAPSFSCPTWRPWLPPKHRDGVWRLSHPPLRRCVPPRLWMRIRWASVRYTADGTNARSWVAVPPRSTADRASVAREDSRQGAQQRKPLHRGTGSRPG